MNCGSGTSASPKATNETSRELGSSPPVTETVGEETPSPYFADNKREYLQNYSIEVL